MQQLMEQVGEYHLRMSIEKNFQLFGVFHYTLCDNYNYYIF
jgi:hypothetical protein